YYLRLALRDEPGVLAAVAAALGAEAVSIHQMRQDVTPAAEADGGGAGGEATVLIVTHETTRPRLDAALAAIEATEVSVAAPVAIRIEQV
ncbi:MAG: ACT domain-containing protein, partial [Pseudomonadota bacterium]